MFRVQFVAMGKKAGAKKKVKKDSANVAEQSHEPMDKSEISAMLGYLKYHAAKNDSHRLSSHQECIGILQPVFTCAQENISW